MAYMIVSGFLINCQQLQNVAPGYFRSHGLSHTCNAGEGRCTSLSFEFRERTFSFASNSNWILTDSLLQTQQQTLLQTLRYRLSVKQFAEQTSCTCLAVHRSAPLSSADQAVIVWLLNMSLKGAFSCWVLSYSRRVPVIVELKFS